MSSGVVQGLASASGDVGVRRVVRLACAAALASAGPSVSSDAIKVLDVHIPAGDGVRLSDIGVKDYTLLSVDDYDPIKEREDIFESLSLFIRRVAALPCACIPGEQEESQVHQALVRYFDVVEKHYRAQRSDILGVIAQLSDLAFERYGMSKPVGFSRRVAASCMLFRENYLAVSAWRVGTRELVASAERVARAHYAFEQTVAASVAQTLQDKLGWEMGRENALVFSYYLHWCTRDREMPCAAIIATHGFSTATSIADAANTILHHHVFDAVDMPLDSAVDEVERDLVQVLQRVPQTRDVLIMIDMGSLKDMSKRLSMHLEANVGIVDNVSLAMALEAGALLLRRQPLGDILSKAVECGRSHATLHRAERVRKVVLFISENGIASARRLAELFAQSLPAEMEFDVLPLDYLSAAHEILDGMFHDMHVALVVGPSNPGVRGVDFLPFERLVNMSENDLSSIELGRHVDEAILNEFRSNLMKHFTLNNIMKRLTVLEPERLMDVIESSVGRLQQHLGMSFSTHMLLWLYVHVAYLVERIVTRQYINEQDLGSFVENEQEFIEKVRDSFRDVEAVYGVELPLGEIHYVFSLINNDSAYRGEGDVDEY